MLELADHAVSQRPRETRAGDMAAARGFTTASRGEESSGRNDDICIRRLGSKELDGCIDGLADVLMDCVMGGASVSFLAPLHRSRAQLYWRQIADEVACNARILLVAEDSSGRILGTVQMVHAPSENQAHKAEVAKVLVARNARRRGIGRRLLAAVTDLARHEGKTLLTLSVITDSIAERLYEKEGWRRTGVIPECVLTSAGRYRAATFFYKPL